MKDLMAAHKTVHPRLRGELRSCAALRARKTGSSPLTRGTQRNSVRIRLSIWFIPAYAGNSAQAVRVENSTARFIPAYAGNSRGLKTPPVCPGGSSPLTRGTLFDGILGSDVPRFIPAYAGNSVEPHVVFRLLAVHPRLRGELGLMFAVVSVSTGSSPLTRGTPSVIRSASKPAPVHPRLRGELGLMFAVVSVSTGSSPLTRGTPSVIRSASKPAPVHPRLRGELCHGKGAVPNVHGSSPLTRGTQFKKGD